MDRQTFEQQQRAMIRFLAEEKLRNAPDADDLQNLENEYLRCLPFIALQGTTGAKQYFGLIQWSDEEDRFLIRTYQLRADQLEASGWPRLKLRLLQIRLDLQEIRKTVFVPGYSQCLENEAKNEKERREIAEERNRIYEEETEKDRKIHTAIREETAAVLRSECPVCHHPFGMHGPFGCPRYYHYW